MTRHVAAKPLTEDQLGVRRAILAMQEWPHSCHGGLLRRAAHGYNAVDEAEGGSVTVASGAATGRMRTQVRRPARSSDMVEQLIRRYSAQAARIAATIDPAIEVAVAEGEAFEGPVVSLAIPPHSALSLEQQERMLEQTAGKLRRAGLRWCSCDLLTMLSSPSSNLHASLGITDPWSRATRSWTRTSARR
jgi:hypothetical protein